MDAGGMVRGKRFGCSRTHAGRVAVGSEGASTFGRGEQPRRSLRGMRARADNECCSVFMTWQPVCSPESDSRVLAKASEHCSNSMSSHDERWAQVASIDPTVSLALALHSHSGAYAYCWAQGYQGPPGSRLAGASPLTSSGNLRRPRTGTSPKTRRAGTALSSTDLRPILR